MKNEKQIYFECYTASKVENRGSKIRVNAFSAKLFPTFENERAKITVSTRWRASPSLVLAGTFFAPFFTAKLQLYLSCLFIGKISLQFIVR